MVVSRTHPNLVRKLFALEVPEIAQGVVEIKINDGIWGGSKVGIVSSEELGNGLKAIFNLEYEANADNGRLGQLGKFL